MYQKIRRTRMEKENPQNCNVEHLKIIEAVI